MIRTDFPDCCQNCERIEVETTTTVTHYGYDETDVNTHISCKYMDICKYVDREERKEKRND